MDKTVEKKCGCAAPLWILITRSAGYQRSGSLPRSGSRSGGLNGYTPGARLRGTPGQRARRPARSDRGIYPGRSAQDPRSGSRSDLLHPIGGQTDIHPAQGLRGGGRSAPSPAPKRKGDISGLLRSRIHSRIRAGTLARIYVLLTYNRPNSPTRRIRCIFDLAAFELRQGPLANARGLPLMTGQYSPVTHGVRSDSAPRPTPDHTGTPAFAPGFLRSLCPGSVDPWAWYRLPVPLRHCLGADEARPR